MYTWTMLNFLPSNSAGEHSRSRIVSLYISRNDACRTHTHQNTHTQNRTQHAQIKGSYWVTCMHSCVIYTYSNVFHTHPKTKNAHEQTGNRVTHINSRNQIISLQNSRNDAYHTKHLNVTIYMSDSELQIDSTTRSRHWCTSIICWQRWKK